MSVRFLAVALRKFSAAEKFTNRVESHQKKQDYLLDKSKASWSNPFMDANYFFGLGLAAAASFRMSLFIEASSFRVGTFFNNSFLPFSMRGSYEKR